MGQAVKVLPTAASASALLSPVRLRILQRLRVPGSASSIGTELGLTRQQSNYHLRELESAGIIELAEERRRGNFLERVYRLLAESYVIAPSALEGLAPDPAEVADHESRDYLVALGAKLVDDASVCGRPTMALEMSIDFQSDETRGQFAQDLANAFKSLAAKYHHSGGVAGRFRVIAAAHPQEK